MSYVNFDNYPFWLSWQVLNKNRGMMADRTCNICYWHYIHYKTMFFLFNSVLYFPHNYHNIIEEEKGNRWDLIKIKYNKENGNFFLSVSKVCASLIFSGGICPGGVCPRGKVSRG